jgi:hypothetical protein
VETFGITNVGIYYRREVKVKFTLRDEAGTALVESEGTCFREVSSDRVGETFVAGLVGKLAEKASGTYLKAESAEAVMGGLAALPEK